MSEPLDVSLRVRMRYEAGDGAARATGDLEKVRTTAERLGTAAAGGERLNQGLRNTSTLAQAVQRDLLRLSTAATRLGSGDAGSRLATGLKDAGQAAGGAAREVTQLGQAAARFGAVSTVSYLARDLKAVHAPAQAAKRDIDALREAADKIGRGTGLRDLEADLQKAVRRADDLERHLAGVNRRAGGRAGRGDHMEFGNEALRASGLGVGGLRFGMGGAAAGGLAVGGAVAATGGAIAMATGQAISFEHAMTEVKKAVNDTPEGMRSLERDILGFSRATGLAKNEVAALVAQAGYLNVPRDQLKGFAEIASKAAIGFQMRPEETGEALGHLRAAYGLKDNAQLRSAGDAINTVGDHVGTRERDVLNYLNRTSGVAGMLKIPLQKNAAIGGAVMSLGVAPDVAATGFDSLSGRLANANLEGKDFQRGLRAVNLSGRRAKAMMQEDATGGLIEVLERLKNLPEAKRINAIRDIAGEGNVAAVSRMVESLDKLKDALALVADPAKYAGSLEKTFKIFSSDTQAQIKRAEAAMESWAAKIGSKFSPVVSAAAAAVERWFNAMNKAMDRQEQAEGIARRMAKGGTPTPEEQAKIDADPRLKKSVDERLFYQRRADEIEAGRKRLTDPPAEGAPAPPSMREARDAFRKKAEEFERRRRGEGIPGTGKRSDLQEGVKASLASYHEEVDQSLTRTERLAREFGKRIREDLEIRPKVQDAAFRFGGGDGARIERASIGGGGIGGGLGSGASGGGGSSRGMPGRFGGAVPMPHGGGGRFGGGSAGDGSGGSLGTGRSGHQAPTNAQGKANVASWLAYAQRPVDQGGLGLSKEQAHGMVAGMQGESGVNLDPGSYNPNDRGAPSGGTMQWRKERLEALRAFAAARGDTANNGLGSVETQQQYQRHEFLGKGGATGGSERRAYEAMKGETTREGTLKQFVAKGERPQFPGPEIEKRSRYLYGHEGGTADGGASKPPVAGQAGGNGQFDPLGGAARRYTSGFGMRDHPVLGGHRMHYGQDMAAPAGTPVSAMQGGRVSAISRMGDVTVTHPDGSTKTYRHIDPSGIKVGQEVEGGSQIGSLRARDPRSTGPHLHLEATDAQGRRYDPRAEINEAGRPNNAVAERERSEPRSSRFRDPAAYQLKPGAGAGDLSGGGGAGRSGSGGASVVQNFHGGFDAHEVGRRAQLEQNREVRRSMAGALHDVGHPVSV